MQDWQKKVLEMTEEETYNLINNLEKMKTTERDYTQLDEIMLRLGFTPYPDEKGFYFHSAIGFSLIDLTAVDITEKSIMQEIMNQTMAIGIGVGKEEVQQNIRLSLGL
jgi:hypothetical protein